MIFEASAAPYEGIVGRRDSLAEFAEAKGMRRGPRLCERYFQLVNCWYTLGQRRPYFFRKLLVVDGRKQPSHTRPVVILFLVSGLV